MRKITFSLFLSLGLLSFMANAQYTYDNVGPDPYSSSNFLFTGAGFNTSGFTNIHAYNAGGTGNTWSSVQTLPFAFDFYGTPVSHFVVSKNHLVSFDTSLAGQSVSASLADNTSLPNASLPNNTVAMFWDNFANGTASLGSNDNVWTGTFGTAPNRQFFVKYFSYETGGRGFSYAHMVFEETTNNMYFIDNYMGGTGGSMTIGVQQDTATAVQVAGSPNISPIVTSSNWTTLVYYTFSPRLLSPNEAGISSVDAPTQPFAPGMQTVTATLTNHGTAALTSANIDWSANGVAQTGTTFSGSLAPGATTSINLGMYNFAGTTNLSVWSSLPNGVADPFTANDTTNITLVPSLAGGVYTIDGAQAASATNFVDFASAVTAMSGGISGAVTFNVAAGTYNEQVSIGSIIGSSDTNTITINGASAATTILTHDKTIRNSTLNLDGTSDITIKNMTIAATGGSQSWAIHIWNDANDVTIDSNIVTLPVGTTFDVVGIMVSGSETSDNSTGDVDDLTISNNTVTGGERGISVYGNFSAAARSQNLTVHNNDIQNADDNGLYIIGYNNVTITDNYVDGLNNAFSDGMYSSDLENFTITGNFLKGGDNGIEARDYNFDNTVTSKSLIANNMFIGGDDGLYFDDVEEVDVFHNSCVGADYGIFVNDQVNLDLRNNIFYSDGGDIPFYYLDAATVAFATFDYNIFYTTGPNIARSSSGNYADIAALQAGLGGNTNSLSGDPLFVSPTADLHVGGSVANDVGDNTVGILVDYDGDTRPLAPSTTVDIGADEFAPPACPFPGALAATNISSDSASISWFENGTATTWEVSYGTAGTAAGAGTKFVTTVNPSSITGLMSATAYEFYVRAICAPTDTSSWSGVGAFTTAIQGPIGFTCTTGNPSAVFTDDLESLNGWTGNIGTGTTLNNWNYDGGGTGSSGTGPLAAHSGTQYVYVETSGATVTPVSFISPSIDLTVGNSFAELSFWVHAFGGNIGTLDVGVSTSATGPFTNLWTYTGAIQAAQADPFQNVGVNLDAYVGQTIYIEFLYTTNGSFAGDIALDLIEVSTCTSCSGPSNLVASNVTTSAADLGWTENGTATEWQVEYGVSGFAQGSGTLVGSTTTNPHAISGLMSGTLYDYYVRAICAVGDTSGWSLSGSFGTAYAIPYVQNFDAFPNTNISSEGWSNSRGSSVPDWTAGSSTGSSGTGPLQDHTTGSGKFVYTETSGATAGLVDTLSGPGVIFDSSQSSIELSYWYHMVGSTMGDLQVWVDTNGVWDSLTTYVGQQQAAQADPWLKGSHILTGYEGQVVKVHFLAVSGASFASDMAVDDVAMNIPPSCVEPNALMANSISTDSAVLAWTENNTATQWEIEYGLLGFTPGSGTIISVTSNPYSLTGLSSSTEYEWRVKSICGPADSSLWSSMSSFKTAFQCPAGAICATYTSGDISTDFGITYPTPSSCPGSLSLVVPAGNQIDSVSTFYDMTAAGGAWMSEQGSYLYSPTTMNFEGSSNDGAGTTAGTFSYSRDGLAFANGATGTVAIEMHAERSWGGSGCASNQNKVDDGTWTVIAYYSPTPLTPIALPITWDDGATVDLSTIDFGGNASMLTLDPMDTTNTVLQSIKGANSQVWAGTSFGDSLDMPIAFAAGTTTIRAVVYSATAGTPVLLKVEDQANGSISSEILANTVTAGGWDTLSFNLSNGNPALNFANTYNKMSIFYNFGNAPAVADTFYVDYVELSPNVAPPVPAKAAIALPITWDDTANVDYSTIDFGGNASMMTADPMNASNLVLQSVKGVGAQTWAGTTFGDSLASAIPFSTGNTTIRAVVYSPTVGIEVRLKVEDKTNPGISVESNVLTTVANGWDTLNFDMSAQSSGTAAINFANTYDKMSIFYNFGVSPTVADTFYVDFVDFANPPPAGPSIPYFEDFEAFTNGTPQQNGWSRVRTGAPNWNVDNGGTPSGATGPTIDHTAGTAAGKYVYLETSGGSLGLRDTLSSPSISVGANLNTLALDYWYHMAGSSMGQMQVWVDTNGVWDSITTYVGPQHTAIADPWLSASHIITGYGGQNVTIHFIGERGSSFTGDMAVDDISLATPPTCIAPNALVTSSIGADSAILGWTENNTVPSPGWEIEWGPLGFTPGSGTVVSVTSNPFTLTGLTTVTDYSWRVRANCTPTDSSSWSSMSSFKTAFQCPAGAICATYTAGDISSDFGFQSLPGASTCADSVTVAIPSGDRIDSITTFYTMTAGNGAWISEQNSWLYSPTVMSGEAALTDGPAVNTAGTGSYSRAGLTFANGATGSVVIQMHAGRDWGGTGCDPSYNKVDSASWTVIAYHSAIPSCLEPISVTGTAVSTDSATVAWSDTNTVMAPSYDLSYGTAGTAAGAGTVITVTGSTAGIGGLMPGTAYDVYVRANCGVGNSSPWSAVASFATFNGVPYTQNFEAFANGSPSSEGWFNTASTNPQWLVDAGGTPSGGTGPIVDHTVGTATGKYVFLETSVPGVAGDADTMVSAPIFVDASQSILELAFWYHFHGATVGSMEAWIIDSSGTPNLVGTIVGQQQPVQTDPWLRAKFVASGYQGQSIRLAFVGIRGTSFTGDIAIDDVSLDLPPAAEVGITDILRPSSGCGLGADSVEVEITNFGANAQTGFSIGYSLNGVAITPETVAASLGAGMTMNYTFSTTAAIGTAGNYDLVTYTMLVGDADASNDTLGTSVTSFATVSAFPYATSFETGNDSWFATGDASWELGTPTGFVIDTASNGTQAWVTDLDANYGDGLNSFLTSPCFDFTSVANPAINLDIWYDIESQWDGAFLQATTDGGATWTTIGSEDDIINWYNDTSRVPVDNNYSTVGDSWTGDGSVSGVNGSNGWITASHELDGLGGQSSVQLRVVFASDANTNGDGLGVDNIEIYDRDPSYPIAILNTEDASGVADSLGVDAWTSGVVVGIDLDGNNGISFTIIDDESGVQEGMNIFNFNDVSNYVVTEGDEILVHGGIIQFNGLTELSPDSIYILSTGNAIPTPIVVTDLDETTESRWLSIPTNWVSLSTSGAFSSNVSLTNGTDTITMRIDSDTDVNDSLTSSGMPIVPGDTICGLFGIGGQFDNSSPYTSGYQIFPMRWSDLTICRLSTGIESTDAIETQFELIPNPTTGEFTIRSNGFESATINVSIRDLSGRLVSSEFINNANGNFSKSFDLNGESKGVYFITIMDGENVINKKLIVQ